MWLEAVVVWATWLGCTFFRLHYILQGALNRFDICLFFGLLFYTKVSMEFSSIKGLVSPLLPGYNSKNQPCVTVQFESIAHPPWQGLDDNMEGCRTILPSHPGPSRENFRRYLSKVLWEALLVLLSRESLWARKRHHLLNKIYGACMLGTLVCTCVTRRTTKVSCKSGIFSLLYCITCGLESNGFKILQRDTQMIWHVIWKLLYIQRMIWMILFWILVRMFFDMKYGKDTTYL